MVKCATEQEILAEGEEKMGTEAQHSTWSGFPKGKQMHVMDISFHSKLLEWSIGDTEVNDRDEAMPASPQQFWELQNTEPPAENRASERRLCNARLNATTRHLNLNVCCSTEATRR